MKKNNIIVGILTVLIVSLTSFQNVFAECKTTVLGVPTWYRGLVDSDCEIRQVSATGNLPLKTFITTVIINIGDMMVRIIGIASVLFIIIGGFKYVLSSGEESKIASAKKTIERSVVGMIISLSSIGIINFVFGLFTHSVDLDKTSGDLVNGSTQAQEGVIFDVLLPQLFMWLGIASVFMITVGGVKYVLAAGDSTKVTNAKKTIKYSVLGLIMALFSFVIVKIIARTF